MPRGSVPTYAKEPWSSMSGKLSWRVWGRQSGTRPAQCLLYLVSRFPGSDASQAGPFWEPGTDARGINAASLLSADALRPNVHVNDDGKLMPLRVT